MALETYLSFITQRPGHQLGEGFWRGSRFLIPLQGGEWGKREYRSEGRNRTGPSSG
jgi:hypothetical protein